MAEFIFTMQEVTRIHPPDKRVLENSHSAERTRHLIAGRDAFAGAPHSWLATLSVDNATTADESRILNAVAQIDCARSS